MKESQCRERPCGSNDEVPDVRLEVASSSKEGKDAKGRDGVGIGDQGFHWKELRQNGGM